MKKKQIAIFASGSGSNAENISRFFSNHPRISVTLILTNKPDAAVIGRTEKLGIPCFVFNREEFYQTGKVLDKLKEYNIDFIVLAGFLWLVPESLISAYPGKMINIHPALLPKYGGKGMYGSKVHEAVILNREKESGITIHFVNGQYDSGDIILQVKCKVEPNDTPESLAEKIHQLEYEYFPVTVEKIAGMD